MVGRITLQTLSIFVLMDNSYKLSNFFCPTRRMDGIFLVFVNTDPKCLQVISKFYPEQKKTCFRSQTVSNESLLVGFFRFTNDFVKKFDSSLFCIRNNKPRDTTHQLKNLIVTLDLTTNLQPTETHQLTIRCHDQSSETLRRNHKRTQNSPSYLLILGGVVLAGGTLGSVLNVGDSLVTTVDSVVTVKSDTNPTLIGGDYTIHHLVRTSESEASTNRIRGRRLNSLQNRKSLCPTC